MNNGPNGDNGCNGLKHDPLCSGGVVWFLLSPDSPELQTLVPRFA